jgi:hypothetical protein
MSADRTTATGASWWMRAEHIAIVAIGTGLALMHVRDIAWGRFIALFLLIDLIGYLPGALAFHRAGGKAIAPTYYLLYNLTHNYLVVGGVLALWALGHGGPEWAMLAAPIHLSGDRGLLGNFSKPLALPFEPGTAGRAADSLR